MSSDTASKARQTILDKARELGFDDCRIATASPPTSGAHLEAWLQAGRHGQMEYLRRNAAKRIDPDRVLPEVKSIISLATSYFNPNAATTRSDGTESLTKRGVIARYAQYEDYHDILGEKLKELTATVDAQGSPDSRSLWYVDTGPILERDLAQRAGIGFIGKHTNLISRRLGNWFFLSEILTTLELPADSSERNRCGTCQRCLTACPTQALPQPFVLDARRCISYLTIELKGPIPEPLRPLIGDRIFGCDDCLAACPWNRFAHEARLMKTVQRDDLTQRTLAEWMKLSPDEFRTLFRGTPFFRTKWQGMLRNVCVALGNTGDRQHLPELEALTQSDNALVAEHAAWAIARIQQRFPAPNADSSENVSR